MYFFKLGQLIHVIDNGFCLTILVYGYLIMCVVKVMWSISVHLDPCSANGTVLIETSGHIFSPGYDGDGRKPNFGYGNNHFCVWKIHGRPGTVNIYLYTFFSFSKILSNRLSLWMKVISWQYILLSDVKICTHCICNPVKLCLIIRFYMCYVSVYI